MLLLVDSDGPPIPGRWSATCSSPSSRRAAAAPGLELVYLPPSCASLSAQASSTVGQRNLFLVIMRRESAPSMKPEPLRPHDARMGTA